MVGLFVVSHPFRGVSDVRAALNADGYSEVDVELVGPFSYAFKARKGAATCAGTVERMPGSLSRRATCFSAK
jgi:hypothetical protein